jgi:hypothetical protein
MPLEDLKFFVTDLVAFKGSTDKRNTHRVVGTRYVGLRGGAYKHNKSHPQRVTVRAHRGGQDIGPPFKVSARELVHA